MEALSGHGLHGLVLFTLLRADIRDPSAPSLRATAYAAVPVSLGRVSGRVPLVVTWVSPFPVSKG